MNKVLFDHVLAKLKGIQKVYGRVKESDIWYELGLEPPFYSSCVTEIDENILEAELCHIVDYIETQDTFAMLAKVIKNFEYMLGGKPYKFNEHHDVVDRTKESGKRMTVPKYIDIQEYLESIPGYESSSVGWNDVCCHDYRLRTDFEPIITTTRYPCGGMPKVKQTNLSMPKPKKMWSGYGRKGFSVTVEWEDGTKTTVTNPNETVTEFTGFCACVAKKIFGSTTKMMKAMEDAQTESKREFMNREHARKMEKERKAGWQEMKKRKHAEKVQARLEELRIAREAEAILAKEEEENDE